MLVFGVLFTFVGRTQNSQNMPPFNEPIETSIARCTSIKVRHQTGTSIYKPRCYASWLEFWSVKCEKGIPTQKHNCPSCGERKDGFVGAHVVEVDNPSKTYICLCCKECNDTYKGDNNCHAFWVNKGELADFDIDRDAILVNHEE